MFLAPHYDEHCCVLTVPTAILSLSLSPLLRTTPVMKMHTKTDFAGAAPEPLGIVAAQILTTALQVCVSPLHIPTSVPPPRPRPNLPATRRDSGMSEKH